MKTGNTTRLMIARSSAMWPQWSPVMKTGNTRPGARHRRRPRRASMEPGHEDREYDTAGEGWWDEILASMEPGHEDREYPQT